MPRVVKIFDQKCPQTITGRLLRGMTHFLSHGIFRYQEMKNCGEFGLTEKIQRRNLFQMPMTNLSTASDVFFLLDPGVQTEPLPR